MQFARRFENTPLQKDTNWIDRGATVGSAGFTRSFMNKTVNEIYGYIR